LAQQAHEVFVMRDDNQLEILLYTPNFDNAENVAVQSEVN
jgi:hypothetical protein